MFSPYYMDALLGSKVQLPFTFLKTQSRLETLFFPFLLPTSLPRVKEN